MNANASGLSARIPRFAGASAGFLRRHPALALGGAVLALAAAAAALAPLFAGDPSMMNPLNRLKPPSAQAWLGTDHLGRDVFARMVHGARISLLVGVSVALTAVGVGAAIGLVSGYFRTADAVVSRLMDGLMAIPAILLAIAMVAMLGSSVWILILAITIPEAPRVVRLVRSVVLSVREAPYVEVAQIGGTRLRVILMRHILPATIAPLTVQATYICAAAIIVESALSFLGAGVSSETATWGGMIAESRSHLARAPWTVFAPGVALAVVVLAVNLVGDGLRDLLDPRAARRA
jgi:peptide/nickel transport system permease protein